MVGGTSGTLTDKGIKSFIARSTPGSKLADGRSHYLLITQTQTAICRIKYRFEGKEKSYSIDGYPQNSLAQARLELNEVKACLTKGQDQVVSGRLNRANAASQSDSTFKAVAEEWFSMKEKEWSATYFTKSKRAFERDVYKSLGALPIKSIIFDCIVTPITCLSSINTAYCTGIWC